MKLVVLGLGVTGDAVVRDAHSRGDHVTVIEDDPGGPGYEQRLERAAASGATVVEQSAPDALTDLIAGADLFVPSPGASPRHPAVAAARAAGVTIRSEVDLAAERIGDQVLVAVTGTNGKTTVTSLVADMVTASGVDALAAGNIGRPLLDAVGGPAEVVVAEVSSFQLAFTTAAFRPRVAVLLNLAEDHLDWHGSFTEYVAAKAKIFANQLDDDALVFNADDERVARLAATAPGRRIPFTVADVATGERREQANARAAAAAATEVGATATGIAAALRDFTGLPHRMQLVGERDRVRYYDDSKATNPHATLAGVGEAPGPVVLIAGGRNKGIDLSVLRPLAPDLRAVVAIGEAAGEVAGVFAGLTPVVEASDMGAAVARAAEHAQPGDVVILSPACASFDWYESYGARGDDFAREVARLLARDPGRLGEQVNG
ncbi:MAG TPA: UDP-N-acetylmuramoyl-L-alanine--D-glutamate ligase [Acidimicrobiia bacterium]|nr:UDP-N-acetylmuramoyl-L-alanine--D-glutamate ligase [Acidimicrobiia bacterium]